MGGAEQLELSKVELEKRVANLEREVARIKRQQVKNLPLFRDALKRIETMRETIHAHSNGLARIEKIVGDLTTTQAAGNANVAELVAFLKGAKTWGGIARKWGPRVLTFGLGIAVTKGWITAENGKNFLAIFAPF